MPSQDSVFAGSIPEIYDRCLGPLLFEPYAEDLAQRALKLGPTRILETASGTGIVTAALVRALPDSEIVATDLNQAMLDVASRRLADARVHLHTADAQSLPFSDGEFDVVVCQFGVMFFPDRVGAYREARRVLRPGGHFLFNAWGSFDSNPIPSVIEEAVACQFPADPPRFLSRTPYGYHDLARIGDELNAAGFVDVMIESVTLPSRTASAREAAVGFAHGSPLRFEIESRDPARLEEAAEKATKALEAKYGQRSIEARMSANVVLARAPV